jgi:S1-C subfamily serine protease
MALVAVITALSIGLGLAVPINLARDVAEQLLTTGVIRRAFLGVLSQDSTPEIAAQLRLPVQQGIVIARVDPGTPAAAGLRRGPEVVSISGLRGNQQLSLQKPARRVCSAAAIPPPSRRSSATPPIRPVASKSKALDVRYLRY